MTGAVWWLLCYVAPWAAVEAADNGWYATTHGRRVYLPASPLD